MATRSRTNAQSQAAPHQSQTQPAQQTQPAMQQSQPMHMQPFSVVFDQNIHMQPHPGQDARTLNVAMPQYPHSAPPYYANPFAYAPYYQPHMPIMDYPGAFDRYSQQPHAAYLGHQTRSNVDPAMQQQQPGYSVPQQSQMQQQMQSQQQMMHQQMMQQQQQQMMHQQMMQQQMMQPQQIQPQQMQSQQMQPQPMQPQQMQQSQMQRNQNQNSTPDITVATITTADTSGTITPNKQTMQGQAEQQPSAQMQASEQVASEAAAARTQFLKSLKDQMGIVDTPLLEYIAKLDLPKQQKLKGAVYDVFCEMMDKHFRRVEPIDVALGREPDVDEIHEYKKPEYKALLTSRRLINRAEIENFRKLLDSLTQARQRAVQGLVAKDFGLRAPRAIEREDNSVQEEWSDVFFNYVIDNMPDTSVQNQCRQFLVKYHTEQQAQKFRTLVYLGRFIRIILDQIAASSMADVLAILQFSTGMEIRQLHGLDQVNDFFEVMGEESPLLEINEMQDGSGNYRRLKFHLTRGYSVRSSTDMPPVLGVMLSRTVLKLLMQHDKDVVDHIDTSKEKHGSKSRRRRMDYVNFLNLQHFVMVSALDNASELTGQAATIERWVAVIVEMLDSEEDGFRQALLDLPVMADIKKLLAVFDDVELTNSQQSVHSSDFLPESLHTDSFDSNDLKHRDERELFKKEQARIRRQQRDVSMKVEDEANLGVQIRPALQDSRSSVESMENISRRLSAQETIIIEGAEKDVEMLEQEDEVLSEWNTQKNLAADAVQLNDQTDYDNLDNTYTKGAVMQNWHDQNTDAVVRLQDVASQPDEGFKSQEVPLRKQKGRLAKQATKNVRIPKYRLQYLERIERSKDHLHGSDFEADKNLSVKNAMAKVVALENRNFGYLDYALGQDTLYSVQDIGILMETYRQQKQEQMLKQQIADHEQNMEQLNREEVAARRQLASLGSQAIDQIFRTQDLLGIRRDEQPVVKHEHADQEMVEAKPLAMPEASFPFGATPEQMEQNRLEHEWKTVIEQLVGVMDDGNYRQRLMSLMQLTGNKNMLDGIMEMFFRIDFLMQSQDLILEEKVRMQNLLRQQMRLSGVDPVEDDLQRLLSCVQMREYYKERAFSRLADAYASKKEAPEVRQNIQGMSLHEPVQRRSSRTSTVPQRMNLGHEAKKSRKKKQRDKAEDDDEEVSDGSGSDGNDEDSDSQSQIVFMDNAVNFVQNTRQVDRQIREYVQAMPAKDKQMQNLHYSQASVSLDVNAMGFGQFNQSVMTQLNNAVSQVKREMAEEEELQEVIQDMRNQAGDSEEEKEIILQAKKPTSKKPAVQNESMQNELKKPYGKGPGGSGSKGGGGGMRA